VFTTVVTAGVLALVGFRLVGAARFSLGRLGRGRVAEIVRGIGWRHVWPVPIVLAAVIGTAVVLILIPGLDFGWWTALGGLGNPVTGTTDQTAGTALEWLIPIVFLVLLMPALPLFAYREEEMFRAGAESWSWRRRVFKALQFGLVHAIIGIPIGVALALSLGGAYFQIVYLREFRRSRSRAEAVLESARAHTAYNGLVLAVAILAIVLTALGVG
jgi:hypothetical protein